MIIYIVSAIASIKSHLITFLLEDTFSASASKSLVIMPSSMVALTSPGMNDRCLVT